MISISFALLRFHTHIYALILAHTYTLTLAHIYALTLAHTYALTLAHTLAHTDVLTLVILMHILSVAEFFLAEIELPEEHRSAVVQHLVFTHQNVTIAASRFAEELRRFYYVTPKNYLDFIANYKDQLRLNHKRISSSTKRLEGGLQKLIEAAEAVDRMQVK